MFNPKTEKRGVNFNSILNYRVNLFILKSTPQIKEKLSNIYSFCSVSSHNGQPIQVFFLTRVFLLCLFYV